MIITDKTLLVKIPIVVDVSTSDKLYLERDNYKFELSYNVVSDFFISANLNSSIFAGEWTYMIGDNIGLIAVTEDISVNKYIDSSTYIYEYNG